MPLESAALREGAGEEPGARRPASGRKPRFPRGWGGTNEESFEGRRGHSSHVCSRRRGTDHGGRSAHRFEAPSRGRRPGRSTRARATLTTRRCTRRARAHAAGPARAGASSLNRQRSASGTTRVRSIPLCAGTSPPTSTASVSSSAASATSALGVSTKRGSTGSTTRRRRSAATSTGYGEATRSSGTSPTSRGARTLARSLSFVRPPTCRRPSHSAYGPSTTRVAGRRRPPACKSGAARQRSPMRSGGRAWRRRARAPWRLRAGGGNIQAAWTARCVNANLARCPATRGERIVGTTRAADSITGTAGAVVVSARGGGRTASSWTAGTDAVSCGASTDYVRASGNDRVRRDCDRMARV
jgi:hypothetical protein